MCAGVGSGGGFRKVPEGSGGFRRMLVYVPEAGSGRFRKVPESSAVKWSRFRRQVPEGSEDFGGFWCMLRRFQKGVGRFRQVPESSGVCRRQVPEGSGEFRYRMVSVPEASSGRFRTILGG